MCCSRSCLIALICTVVSASGGKVIASTVAENEALLSELLGTSACAFKPSIPHLIYQYNLFTNFQPTVLAEQNPEIPDE